MESFDSICLRYWYFYVNIVRGIVGFLKLDFDKFFDLEN